MKNSIVTTILISMVIAMVIPMAGIAQKYIDRSGKVQFEASEALFEEVKAVNESVTGVLDLETGQIAALALVKGFTFKNALMEEHFNENYIESELYPKATFKGQFLDFDLTSLNQSSSQVVVTGTLQLRGKEKDIQSTMVLQKVEDTISLTGEFIVAPGDFDIHIPKIVQNKIAKEVQVKIDFKLHKK